MASRRSFLGQVLGSSAALAASGWLPAAAGSSGASRILNANDRVRVGLIGAGGRGQEILKEAMRCPNTEAVAVADAYRRRLDEVKRFAPGIKTYTDFRRLLDDRGIDAVLIATPQHLHALHFVPALQVGFWYKVLDLKIPRRVTMSGGNYLSPKMQVPDTMDVSMDQPENLLFTWSSGFYNHHYPEGDEFVLGVKGTVIRADEDVRYVPEGAREAAAESPKPSSGRPDIVGSSQETGHMRNFIDCVRSRKEPNCPFEIGFRSAIACQMAIASLRQGRTVRWDSKREGIV